MPRKSNAKVDILSHILMDPCNSVLQPGLFADSSGILSRYKTIVTPAETTTNGYLLWCPNGTSSGTSGGYGSAYYWSESSGAAPANSPTNPFGAGSIANTAIPVSAGANSFVIGNIAADFRTVSACIRLLYTGTVSSCTGRVAMIENLTAEQLLTAGGVTPISVGQLFNLATKTERTSLQPMELKFRPNVTVSDIYRRKAYDYMIQHGTTGTSASTVSPNERFGDVFIGFAWQGVPSNQLVFETIHNIEWRPEANLGYASTVPKLLAPRPVLGQIVKHLDDKYPGWTTRMFHYVERGAQRILDYGAQQLSNMVLGGSPNISSVGNSGRMIMYP